MDRLTEALKNLLKPEEIQEVAKAVEEMVAEAKSELEAEFQSKLEESFIAHQEELKEAEAVAEKGYNQALQIITDQQVRMDEMKQEYQEAMDEGFEEAFNEVERLKEEKENVEVELYKEFDERLQQMQAFWVEKVDTFMTLQEGELYDKAYRAVVSDPRLMEHKVLLDKIVNLIADRVSEEDFSAATSSKLEESYKHIEDLKAQLRIVESKNFNIGRTNQKLMEQVRQAQQIMTESVKAERTERAAKKQNVSGRGQMQLVNEQVVPEYQNPAAKKPQQQQVSESVDISTDVLVLAGMEESD